MEKKLLITGTQRSGTSFLAKFFDLAGFDMGEDYIWDDEVDAGYENLAFLKLMRDRIGDRSFPFEGIDELAVKDECILPSSEPEGEVWEVSCLLQNPVFIHLFHQLRPLKDKLLISDRKKKDVLASKERLWSQFKKDSLLLRQSVPLLKHNFKRSLIILRQYGYEFEVISWPSILDHFSIFQLKMSALGIDVSDAEDVWENLVDWNKVHFGGKDE